MDLLEARLRKYLSLEEVVKDLATATASSETAAMEVVGQLLMKNKKISLSRNDEELSALDAGSRLVGMAEYPEEFTWDNVAVPFGRPSRGPYHEHPLRDFQISKDVVTNLLNEADLPVPRRWTEGDETKDTKEKTSDEVAEVSTHPLAEFRLMEKLRFDEIEITVDAENYGLRVSARDVTRKISFTGLGLFRKDRDTINKKGEIFLAMARGDFNPKEKGNRRAVGRLSANLRDAFGTKDAPFNRSKPRFRVSIPKDAAAKWQAERRTVPYNDDLHDPTSAWLQENDPGFKSG